MDKPESSRETLAQAAARKLARDIGSVITVSQRRSDPDADHRQMIARLKEWEKQVWDLLAALQQAQAPDIHESVVRDLPGRPVAAPCALSGCQYGQAPAPAWPPMVDALKEADRWFDGWCPTATCCAHTGARVHEQIRAALAAAEDKSVMSDPRASGETRRDDL